MVVLSTRCQCSACKRKYECGMYKAIVMGQRVMNALTQPFSDEVVIRCEVQKCDRRDEDNESPNNWGSGKPGPTVDRSKKG